MNLFHSNKQKMFLNLHSRTNKRLNLDFNFPRQRTYLSSLNKPNKEKSYSTSSLKQQFRQFKNKSLSHTASNHSSLSQFRPQPYSPMNPGRKNPQFNSFLQTGNGPMPVTSMKVNDFKKSYLNLDSKLNKCTKPKDYFKPIQQCVNPSYGSSYLQAEKRLEQENDRRSMMLINEIKELKGHNQILRQQNQELRKQRSVDLQLIARQNQIMQKQQELIEANQQAIYINKLNSNRRQDIENQSRAYTFSDNYKSNPIQVFECEHCVRKDREKNVEMQFVDLRILKMEEEKQLMKKQIHSLVYQCENYKQSEKNAQLKYQKQLERNQKLISIIYAQDKNQTHQLQNYNQTQPNSRNSQPINQTQQIHPKMQQYNRSEQNHIMNPINRQPYLNLINKELLQQIQPISIKREKGKIEYRQSKYKVEQKNQLNSPTKKSYEKNANFKSVTNLIKFHESPTFNDYWKINDENVEEEIRINRLNKEKEKLKQSQTNQGNNKQPKDRHNLDWCQNENIRKYLQEINKQKIKEFQQIESLLGPQ